MENREARIVSGEEPTTSSQSQPPPRMSRKRAMMGAIGLSVGGLAPLITGIVGVWGYVTQGYFIAKTGERVDGPAGMVVCGFFILAGVWMIVHAIRFYRRNKRIGFL